MALVPPSLPSLLAFVAILVSVCAASTAGVYVASPSKKTRSALMFAAALLTWLAILSGLVASGALGARPIPFLPIFFVSSNLAALALALSPLGRKLAALPLAALIGFQAFRLPLELVLHDWAASGTIPTTMTWTGANFDVVSGIIAISIAPFAHKHRALAWIANLVGLALLLNVGRVALFSSPLPFAWPLEHPLILALHLPYALIVPVCVAGALAGHVVLTRRLLSHQRGS